ARGPRSSGHGIRRARPEPQAIDAARHFPQHPATAAERGDLPQARVLASIGRRHRAGPRLPRRVPVHACGGGVVTGRTRRPPPPPSLHGRAPADRMLSTLDRAIGAYIWASGTLPRAENRKAVDDGLLRLVVAGRRVVARDQNVVELTLADA